MELVKQNIRPRDIMTPEAFHNAETVDMALGCSTNTMLHLPAIAHECGIQLDLQHVQRDRRQDPQPVPPGPRRVTPIWRTWIAPAASTPS